MSADTRTCVCSEPHNTPEPTCPDHGAQHEPDDIEVIHMTAVEWDQALTNSLNDLGLTWEQLTEQAKAGDFTSLKARQLWLLAAGQGPNQASTEVERLEEALEDAYAERDQQFARKAAALRERDDAKQQLAEAQRTIAAHERHINDTFEANRRDLQKAREQRDEAQDERDELKAAVVQVRADAIEQRRATGVTKDPWKLGVYAQACRTLRIFNAAMDAPEATPDAPTDGEDCQERDVFVGSRTHELRVFTGSVDDAREFAAGLIEQLGDQGPEPRTVSPTPWLSPPTSWTPENWREGMNDTACRIRLGVTSCTWSGPAGLEVRIEDVPTGPVE